MFGDEKIKNRRCRNKESIPKCSGKLHVLPCRHVIFHHKHFRQRKRACRGLLGAFQRRYNQIVNRYEPEAADIDGASGLQRFFYITLPLMCPSVKIIVVTGLIGGMKVFDIIYSMTSGGPGNATETVMTVMMKKGISDGFYSTGAAFGVCFFIIVLIISGQ